MCETPYALSTGGNVRSRAMLTTANLQSDDPAYASLPRVVPMSSHGVRHNRPGYASLSQGNFGSGGYGPRGHSAQVRMGGQGGVLPTIQQADNLDENRVVLYKKSK